MHFQTRSPSRERDHRISLMPLDRTNAMGSSYFRQLRSLADDARDAGEPPLAIGVLFLGLCLAAIAIFFIVIEPPVASDAHAPRASSPASDVEASVAGQPGHK